MQRHGCKTSGAIGITSHLCSWSLGRNGGYVRGQGWKESGWGHFMGGLALVSSFYQEDGLFPTSKLPAGPGGVRLLIWNSETDVLGPIARSH